jgi:hypothetical protein
VADLDHSEGALSAGGELISTLSSEHASEHQILNLELSATHEPLLVAFECLTVPCIFIVDCLLLSSMRSISSRRSWSCTASSYAWTHREPMVTSGRRTTLAPFTMKKDISPVARLGDVRFPHIAHVSSSIHLLSYFFKPSQV